MPQCLFWFRLDVVSALTPEEVGMEGGGRERGRERRAFLRAAASKTARRRDDEGRESASRKGGACDACVVFKCTLRGLISLCTAQLPPSAQRSPCARSVARRVAVATAEEAREVNKAEKATCAATDIHRCRGCYVLLSLQCMLRRSLPVHTTHELQQKRAGMSARRLIWLPCRAPCSPCG